VSAPWHLDLCCVVPAVLSGLLYGLGLRRLWGRAGFGRGASPWQVAAFAAGWLLVAISVLSPLHVLGTRVFVLHMVEHEMLMVAAAPLFVLARPAPVFLWSLPAGARRAVRDLIGGGRVRLLWRRITDPVAATLLHAAALWGWHVPGPFQAALTSEWVHAAQHVSFLGTAILFWWSVLSREGQRRSPGAGIFLLFATSVHTSLLGALLTFSHGLWYPDALDPFAICGLTRGEDQQLAGLVMWIPASLAYLLAALWLAGRWLVDHRSAEEHGPARA
jgi:putative membrane protein